MVYSVDDDTKWLDRTRDYLRDQQLPTENLLALDDFLNTNMGGFDCLLMDLNFVEVRIQFIRQALAHLEAGGLAVFDDVHKLDYRRLTIKILSSEVGTTYSLKPVTKDSFGRFAYAFVSGQHGA